MITLIDQSNDVDFTHRTQTNTCIDQFHQARLANEMTWPAGHLDRRIVRLGLTSSKVDHFDVHRSKVAPAMKTLHLFGRNHRGVHYFELADKFLGINA